MVAKAVFSKPPAAESAGSPAADPEKSPDAEPASGEKAADSGTSEKPSEIGTTPASEDAASAKKPKLDLEALKRNIAEERNKMRLFVIKAKEDFEKKKERGGSAPMGGTDQNEYYSASTGELFGPDRAYRMEATIGKGVFSVVLQCKGAKDNKDYAMKFIRANTMMRRAAEKEVEIYRRLAKQGPQEDAEGARYLINLTGCGTFEHAGHLCFVFDLLKCDMRQALQKYGQGAGLALPTVAAYARQFFQGLRTLRKLKVIHADLKPDNLLMSLNKAEIRICDFGSAMEVSEQVRTAYAQPRYYRAPEIMLGLPYDTQIDVWSAGATVFELATGRILFTGKNNNQMIKQMIEVCGGFPQSMTADGEFSKKHFNADGDFLHKDPDSITGQPDLVRAEVGRPRRPILGLMQSALATPAAGMAKGVHDKWVVELSELVSGCLTLDPSKRIEPSQVLDLPFFGKH